MWKLSRLKKKKPPKPPSLESRVILLEAEIARLSSHIRLLEERALVSMREIDALAGLHGGEIVQTEPGCYRLVKTNRAVIDKHPEVK